MLSKATQSSLEAFATQAALAIESARLYAESAEKARIDHDLKIAAEIQRNMLPEPVFETARSISPRSRSRAGRSAATSTTTWRSASAGSGSRWAMWLEKGRRQRCSRPPCRATSLRSRP